METISSKISDEIEFKIPQYFVKIDCDGFIVEIDIRKLNIIQKIILRLLGIKITKYDEKTVEKLIQKS